MDDTQHSAEILKKLARIEHEIKSFRFTFGIGIIILTLFLTALAPTLIRLISTESVNAPITTVP